MSGSVDQGWERSAAAWIASQGEHGDFVRRHVLDAVMLGRAASGGFARAIDIGCGEGRFVRMLADIGIIATGIDPSMSLIEAAKTRDPGGRYLVGRAESIEAESASVDLVVSYLSLIDIQQLAPAIDEMARVLAPGGSLLIANLTSFNTAGADRGWVKDRLGRRRHYPVDHYLAERANAVAWRGISVVNWHRPLSTYMQLFLGHGLRLTFFDEPAPTGGDAQTRAAYVRAPWAHVMEWRKA